jgi:hypothetical protein
MNVSRAVNPNLRSIVSTTIRSVVIIAIGWLLIMVLLPAALVAAGT